jgi:hypothetical protein
MERVKVSKEEILTAILTSNYFKQALNERKVEEEIAFYGHQTRTMDFLKETLEGFFDQDPADILSIDKIWLWVKEEIRKEILYVIDNAKIFFRYGLTFKMEDYVNEQLKDLSSDLSALYTEQLETEWQGLTPEQAKDKLRKEQIYVALLDQDGKLTTEPHPITTDTQAEVTWKIEEETKFLGTRKQRNINVDINPPIKTENTQYSGRIIRLRPHEVNATTIKDP